MNHWYEVSILFTSIKVTIKSQARPLAGMKIVCHTTDRTYKTGIAGKVVAL